VDDRDWNSSFDQARREQKELKIKQDKKIIQEAAVDIKMELSKWIVTLDTYYGKTEVVYFTDSGKWHKLKGKAKGLGAHSMMKYFKPYKRSLSGRV